MKSFLCDILALQVTREEQLKKLEDYESAVTNSLLLANQTTAMLARLTTGIQKAQLRTAASLCLLPFVFHSVGCFPLLDSLLTRLSIRAAVCLPFCGCHATAVLSG